MISQELYLKKIGEAILLTGSNMKQSAQNLIYDRICKNYTNADFISAIEDVTESDTLKLSYPLLVRRLNYHRMVRREEEEEKANAKEEEEAKQFWNTEGITDDCTSRKCFSCDRRRCDTMARASIDGMAAMFRGEISLVDLLDKLSKEFPGAGFEGPADITEWKEWKARRSGKHGQTQGGRLALVPPPEDDFIPELEVPDNAFQGTFNMDQQPGGNA